MAPWGAADTIQGKEGKWLVPRGLRKAEIPENSCHLLKCNPEKIFSEVTLAIIVNSRGCQQTL